MSNFGSGSNSNGNFWYGNATNFPGFLYKKNLGVGGRRSTKMAPGGNTTCNSSTDLYNKYKPGGGGVGASSTANRRAKNRLATVCGSSNKCFPCYNTLGQYSNYTHNPNGFVPCPGTINIISSGSVTPTPTPTPPSTTYTLTYNRNSLQGGTGTAPTAISYSGGSAVPISNNTNFNSTGKTFGGWNTTNDGTGTYYPTGSALTMPYVNTILYAQWYSASPTYSVTYNGINSTNGTVPSTVNYSQYQDVPISDNTGNLVRTGYTFYGWNTAPNGSGTSYPVTSNGFTMPGGNVTLYAQWVINSPTTWTLTYDGNDNNGGPITGGSLPATTSYPSGVGVSVAGVVVAKSGYTFLGWNTAANGTGSIYQPGSSVVMNSNVKLWAQWVGGTLIRDCTSNGIGTIPGTSTYIWGSQRTNNIYRDNTNNTITGIIQYLYNTSNIGPYGTGDGPSDTTHSGNIKSSLANVVLSQATPTTYEINITYTAIYTGTGTDIPYTVTANLPLTTTYWPAGETFNTITTSISNVNYTFGYNSLSPLTPDSQGSPLSTILNSCAVDGGTTCSNGNCITRNLIITTFYIKFSNGTSTRIGLTSTLRWNSTGATTPYTYVYNYTRVELASGLTSTIPFTTTPATNTTFINTSNI